jgi:hypothetical protein
MERAGGDGVPVFDDEDGANVRVTCLTHAR